MPNGYERNWVRLLAAIDGFRSTFGVWPVRVRIFPGSLKNIREDLFSPEMYQRLTSKIELVADDAPMVAEDDAGNSYSYGAQGFPGQRPVPSAYEWLGVELDRRNCLHHYPVNRSDH